MYHLKIVRVCYHFSFQIDKHRMDEGGGGELLKSLVAGGLAGMAGKTVVAPLDRVKILMQTQNTKYIRLGIFGSLGGFSNRSFILSLLVLLMGIPCKKKSFWLYDL